GASSANRHSSELAANASIASTLSATVRRVTAGAARSVIVESAEGRAAIIAKNSVAAQAQQFQSVCTSVAEFTFGLSTEPGKFRAEHLEPSASPLELHTRLRREEQRPVLVG